MGLPANGNWRLFRQLIDIGHILLTQGLKMLQLDVAGDARGSGALGKDRKVVRWVKEPKEDHSCDVKVPLFGDALKRRVLNQSLVELGEWRVGLHNDTVLPAACDRLVLHVHGVKLELVHCRLDLGDLEQRLNVARQEV